MFPFNVQVSLENSHQNLWIIIESAAAAAAASSRTGLESQGFIFVVALGTKVVWVCLGNFLHPSIWKYVFELKMDHFFVVAAAAADSKQIYYGICVAGIVVERRRRKG